jgi:hypothetical protein
MGQWLTGGADTKLGRERLTSSEKTSSKSICEFVLGADTNPSLICMVPVAWMDALVDKILTERG